MEAYPQKVREQILDAYKRTPKTAEIARTYQVSPSWARGVKHRFQEFNLREAIQQKHGPDPKLNEADREQLAKLVAATPDSTLAELKDQLSKPVSITTIWRTLNQMKLTLKKSPCTPANRIGQT
jgi:transposase